VHREQKERKTLIKSLIDQPFYLALNARTRLSLVRKVEAGVALSTAVFNLKVLHWVKTGKID
jgi:hypothetical protein